MSKDGSPTGSNGSPDAGKGRNGAKVSSWSVVQNEILAKVRESGRTDNSLTLNHAPQVIHKLECPGNITCMTHFPLTNGEMFTCQASASAKDHRTVAWKLAHDNTIKDYKFNSSVRITQMIFIPKCRVYVGYSPTKVLRVFMDPETGCQDVFTIPCVSYLTCMAFNKETDEIVAGGKGFVEIWKVTGKEYLTTLQKGKKLELTISKDAEVTELKVDSRNSQVFIVTEKGMCVINYKTSKQTHIMVNRHSGKLCRCCIYNDGEYLVTGSTDGSIKIWNSIVYTQVHEFPGHGGPITALQGHRKEPLLFSASVDGSFCVWRLDNFQKYMSLDLGAKILSMKILTDKTLFCQTDNDIIIYSLNQFHKLFLPLDAPVSKLQRVESFGTHANRILVSTEDGFVQMLSPVTGATITSMSPMPGRPVLNTFVYNNRERSLYTVLQEGEVVVLNAARNPLRASEILEPPLSNKRVQALALVKVKAGSGDKEREDTLIFMGMKNGQISILESYGMIMEDQIEAHQGEITCLSSSAEVEPSQMGLLPTSRFLVSGGADNHVKIWGFEFTWDAEEENYNVELSLVQKIDCSGTPTQIAMFDNVVCVAIGTYGLTKMYRLGGLRNDLLNQGGLGLAVALTHNSVYDHSDEVSSLDMCPTVRMFLTCSKDGLVKVWDSDNQPVREMNFSRPIHAACFANSRGDILVGLHNRLLLVPMTNYLPQDQLERLAQRMFTDDGIEKPLPYKAHKNRRKHWFDRKTLPKFSTDLQKRISEKVALHSDIFNEIVDGQSFERSQTEMSMATDLSGIDDLEEDAEMFNLAQELEAKTSAVPVKGDMAVKEKRKGETTKPRRRGRGSLRKDSFGDLKEEEEEEVAPLKRKSSWMNTRKRLSSLGKITPRVLKDLELAAKRKRLSIVGTMPGANGRPVDPEEERRKKEADEKALAEEREKEAREAEQIKSLPAWEQFLLKRKPIIALDGYIPNSVVRAAIGFIKPKSPEPEWRLKPVPKVNPKHLPEGWKMKSDMESPPIKLDRESTFKDKDLDIKSMMSLKRESTLQSIKQSQSIKDASMYVGTVYCLLPDGTEPESVPNFRWTTGEEEAIDLTVKVRQKVLTPTPKQTTVITAVPQKPIPPRKDDSPPVQKPAFKATKKIAQKNVSIDLSANMDMRVASRPKPAMELPQAAKREKSLSFRLPTAGTASGTLVEEPGEEEKFEAEDTFDSVDIDPGDKPRTAASNQRENSMERLPPSSRGQRSIPRTPGKVPPLPKRDLTEQELGLLQRIVREEWFPRDVQPALEPVMDGLLTLVDRAEVIHYNKVCDSIVAIAKEIGLPPRYLKRCGDKLTKQTSHPAALVRKKSLWTLRQLGINRKELISAVLPGLIDAKDDIREEAIAALNDLMGEQGQQGLSDLMSSLGISKPLNTKEERQAAIKAISEQLSSDKKTKLPGGGDAKERIQMWVSSLTASDPTSSYESKVIETQKMASQWDSMTPGASRGSLASLNFSDFDEDGDRDDFMRSKSGRHQKSSRQKRSLSRKSSKLSDGGASSPTEEGGTAKTPRAKGAKGAKKGRLRSEVVETGTGMTPEKEDTQVSGTTRAEDDYLFKRYEHYGSEADEGVVKSDGKKEMAVFIPSDDEFTSNMIRTETADSSLSEDYLPPLTTRQDGSSTYRPRGASVQKFYARQEQAATSISQQTEPGTGRRQGTLKPGQMVDRHGRPMVDRHGRPIEQDRDSDIHSMSQYDTDYDIGTHRTFDNGTDIVSTADSGIVHDITSDTSSNMRSLYQQGHSGLSPIASTSLIAGEKAPKKKEPDWRDFFETSTAVQRKRADEARKGKGKKKTKEEEKELGKEGKVVFSTNLPPITYMNSEQPTTAGEAGMRCLHSIRVVEKEKQDSEKLKIESVPGRLSIHTQDQSAGETTYGVLQMTWTTNVPALPLLPETRGEGLVPRDIMQPWDYDDGGGPLPRMMQPGLWTQKNAESLMDELHRKLPSMKSDRGQDYQWKRPLPPAKVACQDHVSIPERHKCEHMRLAKKKMHHFTSAPGRSRRVSNMDNQSLMSLKKDTSNHMLSMIRQSSMSFLPPAPMEDVMKHFTTSREVDAA